MDVVLTTSAASGSRVAGSALIAKYIGALQGGARAQGGKFIPGIPAEILANTGVHAPVAQSTDLLVAYSASSVNKFASWPPYGVGYAVPSNEASWYKVSTAGLNAFSVGKPGAGTQVAPTSGAVIGAFFPAVGFAKATILSVVDAGGAWDLVVSGWTTSGAAPTVNLPTGTNITPWCSQLPVIAGPPSADSLALSGAAPGFLAGLGPGEMTALTAADTTRRRRWPLTTDTDPLTGLVEWPTDITARLGAAITDTTDAQDLAATPRSGVAKTPFVPLAAYIGTPPSILTLGTVTVIPQ